METIYLDDFLCDQIIKEKEYNILLKKTPKQLWIADLDEFLKEYKKINKANNKDVKSI